MQAMAAECKGQTTHLADVLELVIQHKGDTLDLTDLCSLLRVSSSCQLAVQGCSSKQCVEFDWGSPYGVDGGGALAYWEQRRAQLQGFAEWLPKHAGLITEIDLRVDADEGRLLQRHLALALRVCRLETAAAASAASPTAADSRGETGVAAAGKPVPFCLDTCRFNGRFPEQQLLQQLAAAGLQELVIAVWEQPGHISPSYFASLSSSLRGLTLETPEDEMVTASLRAAVERLTALTRLELGNVPAEAGFQLPPMLQDLDIYYDVTAAGSGSESDSDSNSGSDSDSIHTSAGLLTLNISGLAGLQRLALGLWAAEDAPRGGLETLALPPNPTSLSMYAHYMPVTRVTGAGSTLQEVYVQDLTNASTAVLTHLCRLPGIHTLTVNFSNFYKPKASGAVAAALGSATRLTKLSLWSVDFAAGSGLCRQLASLHGLQSLKLQNVLLRGVPNSEVLCLTALTSLNRLKLDGNSWADDEVVSTLARHLTGLCELFVSSYSISLGLLPVLGALTGLTRLWLSGRRPACESQLVVRADDLMLLSGLTRLEALEVHTLQCTAAERQDFMARLPRLSPTHFQIME